MANQPRSFHQASQVSCIHLYGLRLRIASISSATAHTSATVCDSSLKLEWSLVISDAAALPFDPVTRGGDPKMLKLRDMAA